MEHGHHVPPGGHAGPFSAAHGHHHGEAGLQPLLLGLVYGLVHVVGPQHLGTLITLSSSTSRDKAFRVGMACGFGHSFGMVSVAVLMSLLHHAVRVDTEAWEYYGNYFIGASMMLCGAYFILREKSFLQEQADGSVRAATCCHGGHYESAASEASCGHADDGEHFHDCFDEEEACEQRPLLPEKHRSAGSSSSACLSLSPTERDVRGAFLGLFQGLCCPMGFVGVGILAGLHTMGTLAFLSVFLLLSTFGTAVLAVLWASFTAQGACSKVAPRVVYRASCAFTLCLGFAWGLANFLGVLEHLDYTHSLHGH